MNIYKATLLTLALSTQASMASLATERSLIEIEEVEETIAQATARLEEAVKKDEQERCEKVESLDEDATENDKRTCKKGPIQEESEEAPFNPDYNSDGETPIGGVSGGTKIGILDVLASLSNGNQKDMADYNIDNIHQRTKEIVITIDDGPTPGVTDKILDSLAKYNAQAVFFVIGSKAKRHPELLRRMQREGHIVANHTMTHANLGDIPFYKRSKVVKEEILGAHEVVKNYATNSPNYYFRAPYGSWEEKAAKVINKTDVGAKYIGPLLWDIGGVMDTTNFSQAADWACWSKKVSVANCFKGYMNDTLKRRGGVVLFHDLKRDSALLIDAYLKEFASREDYRFISIDEIDFN